MTQEAAILEELPIHLIEEKEEAPTLFLKKVADVQELPPIKRYRVTLEDGQQLECNIPDQSTLSVAVGGYFYGDNEGQLRYIGMQLIH